MVGTVFAKSDAVRWQRKNCQRIHVILKINILSSKINQEVTFMEKLISRREAAQILGVSIATLDAVRNSGQIAYVQYVPNGCVYFTKECLEEYIAKCTRKALPIEKKRTYRMPKALYH